LIKQQHIVIPTVKSCIPCINSTSEILINHTCRQFFIVYILFSLLILFQACNKSTSVDPTDIEKHDRGYIYTSESIITYAPEQINQITNLLGIEHDYQFIYDVQVIRIIYQSIDANNDPIRVSGALMIPLNADSIPIISMNHGTVTGRDEVASVWPTNTPEGVTGLWMASMGYYSCLPDYPGFGVSEILHPYIHAKSLANSIIDMIRAAKQYTEKSGISLSEQLFLTGYSEGGYATLAIHKEIEDSYSEEFRVTASAPMAGPYDLSETVESIFQQESYPSPAYIAFFLTAYDEIYNWNRLNSFFNSPYAEMMTGLFDGSKTYAEINSQLPESINLLLRLDFVSDYLQGKETEVQAAIVENTLLNWKSSAPIRFFHGDLDKTVPIFNTTNAVASLKASGGSDIEFITIKGADHGTAGLPCIFGMIEWFNQLKTK
jgi:predicted esterase